MKKIILITFLCTLGFPLLAQQDPLYSQYFNSPMLINPAVAGSTEKMSAGVAYRYQWAGMAGSPITLNFNSHIALLDNKIGVGVLVVQDKLGDIQNTEFGGALSYRIKLRDKSFYFGMQVGATRYTTDENSVRVQNNPDPAFDQYSETKFNTGAGILVLSDRYTLGISVPRLLASSVSLGGQPVQVYSQNYYLFGSYYINLSERIQLKPSALLRYAGGSSASADINFNFVINQLYTAGLLTRNLNTYGLLLQMIVKNYRFGYVFEVPGKGSALHYTTHELSISFALDVLPSHNHSGNGFR